MKTLSIIFALLVSMAVSIQAQTANSPISNQSTTAKTLPAPTPYHVVNRGANQRVWQHETYEAGPAGQVVTHVHKYIELATGLHYLQNGQWQDSQEVINILPDGTAVATNGQHQAYFPANIYNGVIRMVTPDGKSLQSRPVGLSYDDGTNTVMIAVLTNSIGNLVGSNQLVYPSAFTSFKADLRYTYTKAGFEQDVVLRQQPPTPESLGLNAATAKLQVLTEFFSPPTPAIQSSSLPDQAGLSLIDHSLGFGKMKMNQGRAFLMGQNAKKSGALVAKQWVQLDGRQLLVEEVPVDAIVDGLAALPLTAMNSGSGRTAHMASRHLTLPRQRLVKNETSKTMILAKAESPTQGFVLDYQAIIANQTNYTFQGDTTYYVDGDYNLSGTTIIEGGTVIKLDGSGEIDIDPNGAVVCHTGSYRPAVFTSVNDNSVGESLGSGSPQISDVNLFLGINATNIALHDLRFSYCWCGIWQTPSSGIMDIWNCQFMAVDFALYGYAMGLHNVLINAPVNGYPAIYAYGNLIGENITVDSWALIHSPSSKTVALTNCLLTCQQLFTGTPATLITNSTVWLPSPTSPVYQTVGGGNYYLTNGSPYHNAGTTNISPALLTELRQKTTYPPIVYSNTTISVTTTFSPQAQRDTNAAPDVGYHYDPLDYVFSGVDAATNVTFTAGTSVGWFELPGSGGPGYGISFPPLAKVTYLGTATMPCVQARYDVVQEGGNGLWTDKGWLGAMVSDGSGADAAHATEEDATFTHFVQLTGDPNNFRDYYGDYIFRGNNCEFWSGGQGGYGIWIYMTNCFLNASYVGVQNNFNGSDSGLAMRNCTMRENLIFISHSGATWPVWIENCAFEGTDLSQMDDASGGNTNITYCDFNAFLTNMIRLPVTGVHDVTNIISYNWQSSWFGNYYLPTNSPLINAGSTTADQVGLYHFTTQTNQVKETNSVVDIGYHYLATDVYGNPLDSNGDGIPDYLEDANGDGLVDNGESPWMAPPVITTQPVSQAVVLSSNASFSVTATGLYLGYQWYSNSISMLNATNASLLLTGVQTNSAGNYYVAVSNPAGSISSSNAMLTVVTPPTIVTQPQPSTQTTVQGTIVTFGVAATGTTPFGYQWLFNGTNPVFGATNASIVLSNVQTSSAGTYSVTISNLAGVVNSSNVTLTISLPPLSWLQQYFGLNYQNNTNAAAMADPDGDGTNNLQEYLNGSDPTDYYNGVLPSLMVTGGNSQSGQLNGYLPQAMKIQVTKSGLPLTNAPVTFSVTNGINLLTILTNGGIQSASISVRTDAGGYASIWLFLPTNSPASINVTATTQSGVNVIQTNFTAVSTNQVATPTITPMGGTFVISQNVTVTCATAGAIMHYTLNGKIPTEADLVASNNQTILIQGSSTLLVKAFEDGVLWPSSAAATINITGAIAAGYNHTLALKYDGSVWAAGTNGNGRLGDGTTTTRVNLVAVTNLPSVTTAVEAGGEHSLALESDGTLRAWGYNNNGQLGDTTTVSRSTNVVVLNLTNAMAITAGELSSFAELSDGTVRAWGDNSQGELGDNTTTDRHANVAVTGLSNVVAIAAGGYHCLALQSNGKVSAWGYNNNGQLGDNTTTRRLKYVAVSNLTSVASISAGALFSLAVLSNSTVRAWGDNSGGELGDGTTADRHTNVVVTGLSNVVAVAAGGYHGLALLSDGTVRAWGTNNFGQLGDGSTNKFRLTTVAVVGLSNIVGIAAGSAHSVALRSDGVIFVWGYTNYGLQGGFSSTPVLIQPTNHLTYWTAPAIVNQPQSQSVILGGSASFEVATIGLMPMTYQWYSNATALAGLTNSTLTYANIQTNLAAGYSVIVSNSAGSITSIVANLTVLIPQTAVVSQPIDQTVMAGSSAVFSVIASGAAPLKYQWYGFRGGLISGATNSSFTLSNVQTNKADFYYVVINNNYGASATSMTATLVVIDPVIDADGNGLPDWWELKYFGHTGVNPVADSNGDGIPDIWEVAFGFNPNASDSEQSSSRLNYIYNPADWLNQVSGVKTGMVNLDNEGNATQVSQ